MPTEKHIQAEPTGARKSDGITETPRADGRADSLDIHPTPVEAEPLTVAGLVIAAAGVLAAIASGWAVVMQLPAPWYEPLGRWSAPSGVVLLLVGSISGPRALLYLWFYSSLVVLADPITFTQDTGSLLRAVGWLVPFVVGAVALAGQRHWIGAVGCCFLLFSATVALTYNVHHVGGGLGFLTKWRD